MDGRFKTGMRVEGAATPSLSETYSTCYASVYTLQRLLKEAVIVGLLGELLALAVVVGLAVFVGSGS